MTDDLLTALRTCHCIDAYKVRGLIAPDCEAHDGLKAEAADEIERLRTALALAVGEMSTSGEYSYLSPDQLMQHFLEEARLLYDRHRGNVEHFAAVLGDTSQDGKKEISNG